LNIDILCGNVATDLRRGVADDNFLPQFILKQSSGRIPTESDHICQSCHKRKRSHGCFILSLSIFASFNIRIILYCSEAPRLVQLSSALAFSDVTAV